jgi:hypothetical protein
MTVAAFQVFAQDESSSKGNKRQDQFVIDILWETFDDRPGDLKLKWYNNGINLAYMYDIPFSENFSAAIGIGYSNQNYYSNSFLVGDTTGGNTNGWELIQDETYNKYKVAVSVVEAPIELRFRSQPNLKGYSTKFAIGIKPGYVFDIHDKLIDRDRDKFKTYNFDTVEDFRLGAVVRVGYGKVTLTGNYAINPFFKDGMGPEMHQISAGISLMPF